MMASFMYEMMDGEDDGYLVTGRVELEMVFEFLCLQREIKVNWFF